MTTLREIAQEVGLNVSTVSHVLNQSTRPYSAATRKRVQETAQRLGFVANHAGRRLARSRSTNQSKSFDQVGLIFMSSVGLHLDEGCLVMMGGAENELSKLDASLTFVRIVEDGDWAKVERMVRAGGVDGWLLVGQADDTVADRFKNWNRPLVILGDSRCTQPVAHVDVDNVAGGRLAVQHLALLGHRRIAYLGGSVRFVYQRQTLEGFRAAVKELGLDDDERLIGDISVLNFHRPEDVIAWFRKLDPTPTALFVPVLGITANIHLAARSAGFEVPRDLSILDYEVSLSALAGQRFTRVELPMYEVGRRGAILLHKLALDSPVETLELKIPPILVEGGSTGPPRPAAR